MFINLPASDILRAKKGGLQVASLSIRKKHGVDLNIHQFQLAVDSKPSFDDLLDKLKLVLTKTLGPERIGVVFFDGQSNTWFENTSPVTNPRLIELGEILTKNGFSGKSATSTRSLLQSVGAETAVKLIDSHTVKGYLLLGPRKDGLNYSSKDKKLITSITNILAPAFYSSWHASKKIQSNEDLASQIADLTKQLENTKKQLSELDEVKDEFISMASHQLRTPLTSIKGYLAMLLEGDAGKLDDKQKAMIKAAFISSERMVYLISDFLNVSRLKTGKLTIDRKEVNLTKLIEDEVGQLMEIAKSRGLKLIFHKPKRFPILWLDEGKTQQIVINLIENAVFYSQKGGKVRVDLTIDKQKIDFTVTDEGIGVPKEDQPKLFNKFFRADNAKKARPDGTGLGLFMAKKVIIAQGGAVVYQGLHGKGSVFGFSFPLMAIAIPAESGQTKTTP